MNTKGLLSGVYYFKNKTPENQGVINGTRHFWAFVLYIKRYIFAVFLYRFVVESANYQQIIRKYGTDDIEN